MEMTFGTLANALRAQKVVETLERQPLHIEDQLALRQTKRAIYTVLTAAAEMIVEAMDRMSGDPDLEDATGLEDAFERHSAHDGAGCPIADPGGCEHDGREPDYDNEREEGEHCRAYGVDQTRPIGPDNPTIH